MTPTVCRLWVIYEPETDDGESLHDVRWARFLERSD